MATSRSNWYEVRSASAPATDTVRALRSISSVPKRITVDTSASVAFSLRRRSTARMRASSSRGSKGLGR
ncbi:Uncharacterised protein [Mycobacterium tuberculosis]|nr:Uncharacterised protein [Mycobacterium tuberculosis]